MERVPEWYKTRVARYVAEILSGGGIVPGAGKVGDLRDPRMTKAIWGSVTGIAGTQVAKSYQLVVEPNMENLGALVQYMTGGVVGPKRRLRSRSVDKFYELSGKLESPPTKDYERVRGRIRHWEDAKGDPEEQQEIYKSLVNFLGSRIELYERKIDDQREKLKRRRELERAKTKKRSN